MMSLEKSIISTEKKKNKTKGKKSIKTSAKSEQSREHLTVEILNTIGLLEHYINQDHQQDYKLRMALQRETQQVYDLTTTLAMERRRNERLIKSIGRIETTSSSDEQELLATQTSEEKKLIHNCISCNRKNDANNIKQSKNSAKTNFDSSIDINSSPCSYDELVASYKQLRRQLNRKRKQLTFIRCENEILRCQNQNILKDYMGAQSRLEGVCLRYLNLQKQKNIKIQKLHETLEVASECISLAQKVVMQSVKCAGANKMAISRNVKDFNDHLKVFVKVLTECDNTDCKCTNLNVDESKNAYTN